MKPFYVIRPKADQDLDKYADYLIAEASPEIAHDFVVSAHDTFALLATHPRIGWAFRSQDRALQALRVFRVSRFEKMLVLYQRVEGGVEIVRLIHGSRDVLSVLGEEGS